MNGQDDFDDFDDRPESVNEPLTFPTNKQKFVDPPDEEHRKTELDAQQALNETGFGKFNYKIIAIAGMICMNVGFSITSMGFILPSAACDFNMNTIDKGRLSTSPILGMLCGSCVWGCLADTKGRRVVLLNCLFLQAIFEFLASIISSYWGFIIFKFLGGLALSGQLAVLYTYMGEFQPENHRKKALSLMEIPWVLGLILAPAVAWIVLPFEINVTLSIFFFKSWSLFTASCSLLALLVAFILLTLPETPKYLAETGRINDLRNVLTTMYRENTGNTKEEYIATLEKAGITFLSDRSNDSTAKSGEKQSDVITAFRQFFRTLYEQMMMLLKPPYIGRTMITCIGSYLVFSGFYTLTLWFPELFHRFADFEEQNPGEIASVCIVSQWVPDPLQNQGNASISNFSLTITQMKMEETEIYCNSTIETQVYVHTMLLGLSCIPVAIFFSMCANRLGFRFFLVFDSFGCCAVAIAMFFVTSSTQNLILSCIYEALISVCSTVIFCISVEMFPTNLRVTGSALASFFGRLGSLIGNAMFGYLIDDYCVVLISIVAVELFLAGILGFFIRNVNDDEPKKQQPSLADVPRVGLEHSHTSKYHSSITNTEA